MKYNNIITSSERSIFLTFLYIRICIYGPLKISPCYCALSFSFWWKENNQHFVFVVKIQTHSGVLLCELWVVVLNVFHSTQNKEVLVLAGADVQEAVRHLSTELWEKALSPSQGELTSCYSHYRSSGISTRILTTSQLGSLCSESHSDADLSSQNQISAGWGSKQPCSSGPFGIPSLTYSLALSIENVSMSLNVFLSLLVRLLSKASAYQASKLLYLTY